MSGGRREIFLALLAGVVMTAWPVRAAEIDFSFLTTLGYTTLDRHSEINTNFRGDDPFHPVRVTAFAESWIHPKLGIFLEFLWDQGKYHSGGDTRPRVNGAYAVARPWDTDAVLFKIGLIQTAFGAWAPRTYADKNPLVGIPLMYHYRTPASGRGLAAGLDELRAGRGDRGIPILYDSCWPFGITAFGFLGHFEYALSVTKEAPSNPTSFSTRGGNLMGRLAWNPHPAFTLGGSFTVGRYLSPDASNVPAGTDIDEPKQIMYGMDARYSRGWTEIHGELGRNLWQNPNLADDMGLTVGYVEVKQKVSAGFYLALRAEHLAYDEFTASGGEEFTWGYNLSRVEAGGGYNFSRGIMVKAVWQHNRYDDRPGDDDVDLLNAQLVLTF